MDEAKKTSKSEFNQYMTAYTALRVLTLITGLILLSFPFVFWFVYFERILAFCWLMVAWKDYDESKFKNGYRLDLILTIAEFVLCLISFSYFPLFQFALYVSNGLVLILLIIPIIIWLALLSAKNRFEEAKDAWLYEMEIKRFNRQLQD